MRNFSLHTVKITTLPFNEFNTFVGQILHITTKVLELQSQMINDTTVYRILLPSALRGAKLPVGKVIALEYIKLQGNASKTIRVSL
ncbi:MAG: hypothetical protein DRP93_04300 [Candidatus Neomarinimicrobiota bacterium]|nr:MAG: hypothetical protein DRP93_04300 [Candidatus Neomarinimicrobiota bacterium]